MLTESPFSHLRRPLTFWPHPRPEGVRNCLYLTIYTLGHKLLKRLFLVKENHINYFTVTFTEKINLHTKRNVINSVFQLHILVML